MDNETFPCSPLFLIAGSSFSISSTSQNVGADGESALELRAVPDYVHCTVGSRVSCDKLECFIGAEVKVRAVDGDLARVNLLELSNKQEKIESEFVGAEKERQGEKLLLRKR